MASKAPPNTPERGDRCHLRGRPLATGVLAKLDDETKWVTVQWDSHVDRAPKICHLFELEREPS